MSLAGDFLQEVWAHGLPDDMAIELRLIGTPTKSAWRTADQLALVPDPVSQEGTATFSVCAGAAGSGGARLGLAGLKIIKRRGLVGLGPAGYGAAR